MELILIANQIINLMTDSDQPFKISEHVISEEAQKLGLIIRYDSILYRGEEINFLSDVSGVQCFAQWNNQLVDLGLNNIYYKEDTCKFIDHKLDIITTFRDYPNFVGAKLEYFQNGDYRDIRLSYKGRILKVFLTTGEVAEDWVISESVRLLSTSGLIDEI